MSVDSLGLLVNNLNFSEAAGSAGKESAGAANTGDSTFQNLITQMLLQNNAAAVGNGTNAESGSQTKSNGISDLLSALLLGGGGLTNLKLLNLENKTGETAETIGEPGKEAVNGGDSVPTDLLAMLLGLTNASEQGNVNAAPEIQDSTSGIDQMISAIQAANHVKVNGAVSFAQESGQYVSEAANPLMGRNASDPMKAVQGSEGKAAAPISEAFNPMNQIQADTDTSDQKRITLPEIQESAVLNKKQNEAAAITQDTTTTALTEKTKQEMDGSIAHGDPDYSGQLQAQGLPPEIPVNGTVTQPIEKAEPYSQIGDQILAKLEQNGPKEFKMQLEPEDLGQIDIKLKLNDGKLMIDILAANSKTQALLTSQVDKLISSMGLQNVQVESVQVGQQMNSQSQDSQQNQAFFMNSGMDFSQRKNQEHFQEEFLKGTTEIGAISQQQDELQSSELTDRISLYRYASNRMNYAV